MTTRFNSRPFLLFAAISLSLAFVPFGCGFFDGGGEGGHRHHDGFEEGFHGDPHHRPPRGGHDAGCDVTPLPMADSGIPPAPTPDSGVAPIDAGVIADAGTSTAAPCQHGPDCQAGEACVNGSCQQCSGGSCACLRDDDCGGQDICEHQAGVCQPRPVLCSEIHVEATCLVRADCQTVYGGIHCTDSTGGECVSGDQNCTCEMFTFTACIDRS